MILALLLAAQTVSFAPPPESPVKIQVVVLPTIADTRWQITAVGDVTGLDSTYVLWRNAESGDNVIWHLKNGVLRRAAFLPSVFDLNWKIVGASKEGILWHNANTGVTALWQVEWP